MEDADRAAVAEAREAAAVRRAALLALTPSERLALVADLCRQATALTPLAQRRP